MNRTVIVCPKLSWQSARKKDLQKLFSTPKKFMEHSNFSVRQNVSDAFIPILQNVMDPLIRYLPTVHQESPTNGIPQMVDIMAELCNLYI